jgi:hypothetical protein
MYLYVFFCHGCGDFFDIGYPIGWRNSTGTILQDVHQLPFANVDMLTFFLSRYPLVN